MLLKGLTTARHVTAARDQPACGICAGDHRKLLWSEWSRHRSYYSSEDEGQKAEKRRKFEEHRKKHYQMSSEAREALHR